METVNLPFGVLKENLPFPLRLYKPGTEWVVELCWPEDHEGHVAVCGLFHAKDYESAKSFYDLAHRIISCWHVDLIWHGEGKLKFGHELGERSATTK